MHKLVAREGNMEKEEERERERETGRERERENREHMLRGQTPPKLPYFSPFLIPGCSHSPAFP